MKKRVQHLFVSFICCAILIVSPVQVFAEPGTVDNSVIITEIQTGLDAPGQADEEFIELYNSSDQPVDISNWQIRFLPASGSSQATNVLATISSGTILNGQSYYTLAPSAASYSVSQTYTTGLSKTDKTVGLFAPDVATCQLNVQDAVAWSGSGDTFGEGEPVFISTSIGNHEKLLQRYIGDDDRYIDTNNNAHDFVVSAATPGSTNPRQTSQVSSAGRPSLLPSVVIPDCTPADETEEPPEASLPLELTELFPNPDAPLTDAQDEFIELYNPNHLSIDISGYVLETGLTTKYRYTFPVGSILEASSFTAFFSAETHLVLSNTSGQARLIDTEGTVITESDPYSSAAENQTWALMEHVWTWSDTSTPNAPNEHECADCETPPDEGPDEETPPPETIPQVMPQLTELLPNPAAPQTDAQDEFVELFNPNDTTFDLSGFTLEVGTTTKRRFVFPNGTLLLPNDHRVFYSADTGLSLSNSGGQARLIDLTGNVVAESATYGTAKDGQAWALVGATWQWTTSPTPNGPNSISLVATSAVKKTASSTKKKTAVKPKATTKSKKTIKKSDDQPQILATTSGSSGGPFHPGVLALIGGFALLYGAYEYRHDLANRFRNLRANRKGSAAARQGVKGR